MDMGQLCKYLQKPFSVLREKGFLCVTYTDDPYLQGSSYEDCFSNVLNTTEILIYLRFTIHPDKAKFIPTQCITFLGFILNFIQMTITLNKKLWKQKKKITKKFLEKCSYNKISIET